VTADLTAEIAALAADVQARAAALTTRIHAAAPADTVVNDYVDYLTLAADLIADTARQVGRQGLYLTAETTDLDTADPDSVRVDELLAAEYATA
jgi:hypothetical protein